VATHAWPYAVSRDERIGYQAVVVPEFLADAGQAYVLEYASKGQVSQPDTVTVRELHGTIIEPLSLAYRVTEVLAEGGEPSGDDGPENRARRTVRVFEGLVLQLSAEQVVSLGLTAANLDTVTSVAAPALRKQWAAKKRIEAEPSTAISIGDTDRGARLLDLQIVKPWMVPPRGRPGDRPPVPLEAPIGRRGLIAVAVIVCALAAALMWYLIRLIPESPPAVQASTSLATFESGLFGPGRSWDRTVTLTWQQQEGRGRITAMSVSP
jgi:hypothetical protein